MMNATLYKIVSTSFQPIHGGTGRWFAPKGKRPGKWMPIVKHVESCVSGYHLIPKEAIVYWLSPDGSAYLCTAEGRGGQDDDGSKMAFGQARLLKVVGLLDDKSIRLAAADIAERVLPVWSARYPDDDRPARAIQAARNYARGMIRVVELNAAWSASAAAARAAASAAAYAAASAAAYAAASAAAYAADSAAAARAAAYAADSAAAYAADSAAAYAADSAAAYAAARAARAATYVADADIILARAKKRLEEVQ